MKTLLPLICCLILISCKGASNPTAPIGAQVTVYEDWGYPAGGSGNGWIEVFKANDNNPVSDVGGVQCGGGSSTEYTRPEGTVIHGFIRTTCYLPGCVGAISFHSATLGVDPVVVACAPGAVGMTCEASFSYTAH